MKYRWIHLSRQITFLFLFLGLSGCQKNYIDSDDIKETTVLIYMAANNDLRSNAIKNVIEMQKGFKDIHNGNLLVFLKINSRESQLLRIKYSPENRIVSDTLKSYGDEKSTDAAFFTKVINDSRKIAPAKEYGLVLWSHATSWLPHYKTLSTKSFGVDSNDEMDIKQLYAGLPSDHKFIAFDACFMGSVEVSYAFKDKADLILSSPSEILNTGFPYQSITTHLFRGEEGLKYVAKEYISHYSQLPGANASATISLIRTAPLNKLATLTKNLIQSHRPIEDKILLDNVQKLFFEFEDDILSCYDLQEILTRNFSNVQLAEIRQLLHEVVLYKGHTPFFFHQPIQSFSGLSVYYPAYPEQRLNNYYQSLQWSLDSHWNTLFINK